jgi:hypothetical protein
MSQQRGYTTVMVLSLCAVLIAAQFSVLAAAPVAEPPGKKTFLKHRLTVSVIEEVGATGLEIALSSEPAKAIRFPTIRSSQPGFGTLSVGDRPDAVNLLLDSTTAEKGLYDLLYIDLNGDAQMTANERFQGRRDDTGCSFGPIRLDVSIAGTRVPQWFQFRYSDYEVERGRRVRNFTAINSGYYVGRVEFGKRTYLIALSDQNANGMFADLTATGGPAGDRLLIDLNGDGRFDVRPGSEESQTLGQNVLLDGAYWQVHVEKDGGAISVGELEQPLGELHAGVADFALLLRDKNGDMRVRGKDGMARVPVGDYHLARCQYAMVDPAGRRWVFTGSGDADIPIVITTEKPARLPLGPPLTPRVNVERIDDEKVAFLFTLTGAGGESYHDIYYNDQIKPATPKVRVHDLSGRQLAQMDFHFG